MFSAYAIKWINPLSNTFCGKIYTQRKNMTCSIILIRIWMKLKKDTFEIPLTCALRNRDGRNG